MQKLGTNRLVIIYFLLGSLWIIGSDTISFYYSGTYPVFQSMKGILFVLITTITLYFLIRNWGKQLQQSQQEYMKLFEENPLPMWLYDTQSLKFLAVNQAAVRAYEYSKEAFLKMRVTEILAEEDIPRFKKNTRSHTEESQESNIWEHANSRGDHFFVQVKEHATTFHQHPARMVSAANVHEQQLARIEISRLNKELLEQNDHLKKTNEELDTFVYRVSHDLRSPISSALGLIDISLQESDIGTVKYYLKLQQDSLCKLDKFIRDILTYSRNARQEVSPELIQLRELISEIIATLQPHNGDEVNAILDIRQDADLYADEMRLRILFNNLISNAFKYKDPNKAAILRIQASVDPEVLKLTVEDNGMGIKKEHQQQVFDMFFRANHRNVGSGLGLYIVKETILKMKGNIRLESVYGEGSTFFISLPNMLLRQKNLT
jgi:PAS domain S-box-containing protein